MFLKAILCGQGWDAHASWRQRAGAIPGKGQKRAQPGNLRVRSLGASRDLEPIPVLLLCSDSGQSQR